MMQNKIDPSGELSAADFDNTDIEFTDSIDVLRNANFFIVAVPTPIGAGLEIRKDRLRSR